MFADKCSLSLFSFSFFFLEEDKEESSL